jgi:hypothetical protein
MKMIAKLLAVPALSISAMAFAADPADNELVLSAAQMDGVTAGSWYNTFRTNILSQTNSTTQNQIGNINVSPAIGVQVLTFNSSQIVTGGSITQSNYTLQYLRR